MLETLLSNPHTASLVLVGGELSEVDESKHWHIKLRLFTKLHTLAVEEKQDLKTENKGIH